MSTAKSRILSAWKGEPHDYVPLTTWCFGFPAPPSLRWQRDGREVLYWYTQRLEHIHTLPEPWKLEDDFQRVLAWQSLEVDDVLDVSVPWSIGPGVSWSETFCELGQLDSQYPVWLREYQTPSGKLRRTVRKTPDDQGPGWVVQPEGVPLFEDFNVSRGLQHLVGGPEDVLPAGYLYRPPDAGQVSWFEERMGHVQAFANQHRFPVQAWAAFGLDALVWMAGVQGAVYLCMDHPLAFERLMDQITETDCARVQLAAQTPGVNLVVERGWYASTEIWSPKLLDRYLFPHIATLSQIAHQHGKLFGYVMTTGIGILGKRLAQAGVDVLYFVDPLGDRITLEEARHQLSDRLTIVGGVSTLSLSASRPEIAARIEHALRTLGPTNRFILHPVDSLFPDTPWEGVQALIEAWKKDR